MLALNRYLQLLQAPLTPCAAPIDDARWSAIEDEIERPVLGALPKANGDPMLLFGIAKALRFIDRGYLQLAARLTNEAFRTSTAFAPAFDMNKHISASIGDIDRALELYQRAIELTQQNSQFHIYLLVIKAVALVAGGPRSEVDQLTAELYAPVPEARIRFGLFFLSPRAQPTPATLGTVMTSLAPEDARRMLMYLYRIAARQFQDKKHQMNVLHGAAVHLVAQYGPAVIPPELEKRFPKLSRTVR